MKKAWKRSSARRIDRLSLTLMLSVAAGVNAAHAEVPTVRVTSGDIWAAERGQAPATFRFERNRTSDFAAPLTVTYRLRGSARWGEDFTIRPALSGTANIPAGQFTTSVALIPMTDNRLEGEEIARIELVAQPHYRIDSSQSAVSVHIVDDPVTVTLQSDDTQAAESGPDTARLIIRRSANGALDQPLEVTLSLTGSATPSRDYRLVPSGDRIALEANALERTVWIEPHGDWLTEPVETIDIRAVENGHYRVDATAARVQIWLQDGRDTIFFNAMDSPTLER